MKYTLNNNTILLIDNYLKEFNIKYVYCGDFSLYLNGVKEITEFEDVDIDFCESTEEEKLNIDIGLIFGVYPIDKLTPIESIPLRYHEITFNERKILISDLDYELEVKELLITYEHYQYKEEQKSKIELIKKYL